jgi:hypothetical protein
MLYAAPTGRAWLAPRVGLFATTNPSGISASQKGEPLIASAHASLIRIKDEDQCLFTQ